MRRGGQRLPLEMEVLPHLEHGVALHEVHELCSRMCLRPRTQRAPPTAQAPQDCQAERKGGSLLALVGLVALIVVKEIASLLLFRQRPIPAQEMIDPSRRKEARPTPLGEEVGKEVLMLHQLRLRPTNKAPPHLTSHPLRPDRMTLLTIQGTSRPDQRAGQWSITCTARGRRAFCHLTSRQQGNMSASVRYWQN